MGFRLANHLSFCRCGGRHLFLDLANDRYFALEQRAEASFCKIVEEGSISEAELAPLSTMIERGYLLLAPAGSRPTPCPYLRRPVRSLVEGAGRARFGDVVHAVARLAIASSALKRRPLRTVIRHLVERKARTSLPPAPEDELSEIAAALKASRLVATPLDQCLPRSIAAMHMLLDRGWSSELVVGVRLQPFAAHCWLQSNQLLVNESVEQVRNFTPILVI